MTKGVSRKNAASPRSAGWTLYNPKKLAETLELPLEKIEQALEENGYSKAVRILEELIKWKERLRLEERDLTLEIQELHQKLAKLKARENTIREMLVNVRNILRIPREDK